MGSSELGLDGLVKWGEFSKLKRALVGVKRCLLGVEMRSGPDSEVIVYITCTVTRGCAFITGCTWYMTIICFSPHSTRVQGRTVPGSPCSLQAPVWRTSAPRHSSSVMARAHVITSRPRWASGWLPSTPVSSSPSLSLRHWKLARWDKISVAAKCVHAITWCISAAIWTLVGHPPVVHPLASHPLVAHSSAGQAFAAARHQICPHHSSRTCHSW